MTYGWMTIKHVWFKRALIKYLGFSGRCHQYRDHMYCHYNDNTYMNRQDFLNTRR